MLTLQNLRWCGKRLLSAILQILQHNLRSGWTRAFGPRNSARYFGLTEAKISYISLSKSRANTPIHFVPTTDGYSSLLLFAVDQPIVVLWRHIITHCDVNFDRLYSRCFYLLACKMYCYLHCHYFTPVAPVSMDIHYSDVIMGTMASQIISPSIVYSTVYSGADQRKHQSSVSLAFVRGIHRGPVNSAHKWPVTRKMFPFDDVIMSWTHIKNLGKNSPCPISLW